MASREPAAPADAAPARPLADATLEVAEVTPDHVRALLPKVKERLRALQQEQGDLKNLFVQVQCLVDQHLLWKQHSRSSGSLPPPERAAQGIDTVEMHLFHAFNALLVAQDALRRTVQQVSQSESHVRQLLPTQPKPTLASLLADAGSTSSLFAEIGDVVEAARTPSASARSPAEERDASLDEDVARLQAVLRRPESKRIVLIANQFVAHVTGRPANVAPPVHPVSVVGAQARSPERASPPSPVAAGGDQQRVAGGRPSPSPSRMFATMGPTASTATTAAVTTSPLLSTRGGGGGARAAARTSSRRMVALRWPLRLGLGGYWTRDPVPAPAHSPSPTPSASPSPPYAGAAPPAGSTAGGSSGGGGGGAHGNAGPSPGGMRSQSSASSGGAPAAVFEALQSPASETRQERGVVDFMAAYEAIPSLPDRVRAFLDDMEVALLALPTWRNATHAAALRLRDALETLIMRHIHDVAFRHIVRTCDCVLAVAHHCGCCCCGGVCVLLVAADDRRSRCASRMRRWRGDLSACNSWGLTIWTCRSTAATRCGRAVPLLQRSEPRGNRWMPRAPFRA